MRIRTTLVVLAATACARPAPVTTPSHLAVNASIDALVADSVASALLARALNADALGENPDSLYDAEAEVIADGLGRARAPRFAGVGADGRIQLAASRTSVTGGMVWGTLEYRWVPGDSGGTLAEARATVVIGRRRDGLWRILHLHSSTSPTERPARP